MFAFMNPALPASWWGVTDESIRELTPAEVYLLRVMLEARNEIVHRICTAVRAQTRFTMEPIGPGWINTTTQVTRHLAKPEITAFPTAHALCLASDLRVRAQSGEVVPAGPALWGPTSSPDSLSPTGIGAVMSTALGAIQEDEGLLKAAQVDKPIVNYVMTYRDSPHLHLQLTGSGFAYDEDVKTGITVVSAIPSKGKGKTRRYEGSTLIRQTPTGRSHITWADIQPGRKGPADSTKFDWYQEG